MCDDVFDDDEHGITYNLHSDNYHEVECLCGFIDYQLHNYDANLCCTNCGFTHSTHSFYKYMKIDTTFHNKICLCGYTIKERHLFKDYNGGLKCTSCGYFTSDYIFINSYLDQIKNTLYIDNNENMIKKKEGENQ